MSNAILQVDDIQKYYGNKGSLTKAVDHISFQVCKGELMGIMGASGSGKDMPELIKSNSTNMYYCDNCPEIV